MQNSKHFKWQVTLLSPTAIYFNIFDTLILGFFFFYKFNKFLTSIEILVVQLLN